MPNLKVLSVLSYKEIDIWFIPGKVYKSALTRKHGGVIPPFPLRSTAFVKSSEKFSKK